MKKFLFILMLVSLQASAGQIEQCTYIRELVLNLDTKVQEYQYVVKCVPILRFT